MKKVISCMICALLLVGCMAGCGSTGGKSGSGNGIKIMMSLSQGDDFRNTIVEQAKKTAQEKGATLDVYDEDGSLESQVEHIKQAAKEKYDVIFMWTGQCRYRAGTGITGRRNSCYLL